ncbi:hypothetical protein TRFO_16529 [Tritrichomonas foetus]|uniref:Uncharacterized protein n=1 Tax=Tritrichomonas foetus TaxID=1144522 RepID=A0A1J4KPW1_9EUKA|nr:hypothetical protein TRFO_16529 [Tritrichomonas foetus]|eukprot:OHT13327.1 hypothetical protein TRFO_16529 [Tritrichomonas foetus]
MQIDEGLADNKESDVYQSLMNVKNKVKDNVKALANTDSINDSIISDIKSLKADVSALKRTLSDHEKLWDEFQANVSNFISSGDDFNEDVRSKFKHHLEEIVGTKELNKSINELKQQINQIMNSPARTISSDSSQNNESKARKLESNDITQNSDSCSCQEDLRQIKLMLKNQASLWTEFESTIQTLVKISTDELNDADFDPEHPPSSPSGYPVSLPAQIRTLKDEIKRVREEISAFTQRQNRISNETMTDSGVSQEFLKVHALIENLTNADQELTQKIHSLYDQIEILKSMKPGASFDTEQANAVQARSVKFDFGEKPARTKHRVPKKSIDENNNEVENNEEFEYEYDDEEAERERTRKMLENKLRSITTRLEELTHDFCEFKQQAISSCNITDIELLSRIQNISFADRINRLENYGDEVSSTISCIKHEIKVMKIEMSQMDADKMNELNDSVERSNIKASKVNSKLADLESKLDNLNSHHNEVSSKIGTIESQVKEINTRIVDIDSKLSSHSTKTDTSIENLESQLKATKVHAVKAGKGVECAVERIDGLAKDVTNLTGRVDSTQNEITKVNETLDIHLYHKVKIENVETLKDVLDELESEIKELKQPQASSEDVVKLQEECKRLNEQVELVYKQKLQVNQLFENIDCLKNEIEEVRLSAVQDRAVTVTTDVIEGEFQKLQEMESNISKITTDFENIKASLETINKLAASHNELKKIVLNDHREVRALKAISMPNDAKGGESDDEFKFDDFENIDASSMRTFDDLSAPSSPIVIKSQINSIDDCSDALKIVLAEQNRQKRLLEKLTDFAKEGEIRNSQMKYHARMIQELRNRLTSQGDLITNLISKTGTQEKSMNQLSQTVRYLDMLNIEKEIDNLKESLKLDNIKIDGIGTFAKLVNIVLTNKKRIGELGKFYNNLDNELVDFKDDVKRSEKRTCASSKQSSPTSKVAPRLPVKNSLALQSAQIARVIDNLEDSKFPLSSEPKSKRKTGSPPSPRSPQSTRSSRPK